MKPLIDSLEALETLMLSTEQTKGLNVLDHGLMVAHEYIRIIRDIEKEPFLNSIYIQIKDLLLNDEILFRYHKYHDCGKPLVKDENGRFPDHTNASSEQWNKLFPEETDIIELMKLDMEFHTKKGDDIINLWSHRLAPSLYMTAWAELYANASMFGGIDSDSFKIKRKRLIQAGKKFIINVIDNGKL